MTDLEKGKRSNQHLAQLFQDIIVQITTDIVGYEKMNDTELCDAIKLRKKFTKLIPYMNSKLENPENSVFEPLLKRDIESLTSLK